MDLSKLLGKSSSKSESEEKTSPKSGKKKQRQVKELLSREFRVVKNGLDPAEVMAFLEEVAGSSDAVLGRLERYASLQRLSETMGAMAEESRQMAEHIKERARKEAEAEKAQIIEEAQRRAQEIIDETKRYCIACVESTNSLLLEATTKARETEETAFKEAKERVDTLLGEIRQNVCHIADATNGDLNSGSEPVAEELSASPVEAVKAPSDATVQEAVVTKERDPELVRLEEALESALGSQTMAIGTEEEKEPVTVEAQTVAPEEASPGLHSGKVTLLILGGVGQSWMLQLRQRLSSISGVQILLEAGSDTGGTIITLSLDKPVALTPILLEMPDVERVVEDGRDMEESSGGLSKTLRHRLPDDSQRTTLMVLLGRNGESDSSLSLE